MSESEDYLSRRELPGVILSSLFLETMKIYKFFPQILIGLDQPPPSGAFSLLLKHYWAISGAYQERNNQALSYVTLC